MDFPVADPDVIKILLVVHTRTFFPRMLEVAQALRECGRYEPVFHLTYTQGWADLDAAVQRIRQLGMTLTSGSGIAPASPATSSGAGPSGAGRLTRMAAVLRRWRVGRSLLELKTDLVAIRALARTRRLARRLIREENAEAVILALDVATYDTCCYVAAAADADVPSIIAISCTRSFEEAKVVYSSDPALSLSRPLNRIAGSLFPQWRAEQAGKRFLLLPGLQVIAREVMHLGHPAPWIEGSSRADAVLAENQNFFDEGLSEGLDPRQMILTGQPVHDVMARAAAEAVERRERLYEALKLPPGKPMILSSLIPDYRRERPDLEFDTYEEFLRFWMSSVEQLPGYNHVVSLHPSMAPDDFRWLERGNTRISFVSIAELIPLSRFFVTSVSSSISYAIAACKPSINYDAFRYRHTMFTDAPGVVTMESKQDFLATLQRVATHPAYFNELQGQQLAAVPRWGRLDGRAGERTCDLVDTLRAAR